GVVRGLSPGRFGQWLWRVLARDAGEAVAFVTERADRHQQLYAGVQEGALLQWSQWAGLGLQSAALGASLVVVVVTDLEFGWSTTLTSGDAALDAQRVHRVTTAIAAPWS